MSNRKKPVLGRNLSSMLSQTTLQQVQHGSREALQNLPLDAIRPGRFQPRSVFDQEKLSELADSIRAQGVVQPVVVRPFGEGDGEYELIAGERRWRAAQLAGLQKIPAVVRELDAKSTAAIALIENIQREDLNPLEEAQAFMRLIEEFDLTHQQVADSVGRSRAAVSNLLRLLDLAEPVKEQVNKGLLDMGHARALLALIRHDQIEVARLVVNRGLSVRETELLVKKTLAAQPGSKTKPAARDPDVRRLENQISETLGAGVKIKSGKKGAGQLIISFNSAAELDGIIGHLKE